MNNSKIKAKTKAKAKAKAKAKTAIHLHGALSKMYKPIYHLYVKNPAEAIRALCTQLPGFEAFMQSHEFNIIKKKPGAIPSNLDLEDLLITNHVETISAHEGEGGNESIIEFHIVPVICGAGGDGSSAAIGKILVGGAILSLSYGAAAGAATGWAGTTGVSIFGSAVTFGDTALFGASVLLAGFASLLSPFPERSNYSAAENRQSSQLFNGGLNATEEGNVVPIVYGEMIVGSLVISGGILIKPRQIKPQ